MSHLVVGNFTAYQYLESVIICIIEVGIRGRMEENQSGRASWDMLVKGVS